MISSAIQFIGFPVTSKEGPSVGHKLNLQRWESRAFVFWSYAAHHQPLGSSTFTTSVEFFNWVTVVASYQVLPLLIKWCVTPMSAMNADIWVYICLPWTSASQHTVEPRQKWREALYKLSPTHPVSGILLTNLPEGTFVLPLGISEIKVCKWVLT